MSASSCPDLKFSKPAPRVLARHRKRVEADAALDAAYADVDLRDGGFCLVTGRYTSPGAVDARVRREHHHLVPRSQSKALKVDAKNIVTVCAEAHALITSGLLVIEGTDASKPLFVHWAAHVRPEQKPFPLKSKRDGGVR